MPHPVIWTVGLAAVGLIAAGVWLNRPDRQETLRLPARPEAVQMPAREEPRAPDIAPEREPEPEPEREPEPEPEREPEPEPAAVMAEPSEPGVEEPPAEQAPEPESEAAPALPPKDELPPPATTDGASAGSAPEPDAAALPLPEPTVEDTAAAQPESPVGQVAEAMSTPRTTENPVAGPPATYRGGPVWQPDLPETRTEGQTEERRQAIAAALAEQPAEAPFFGALALAPDGDRFDIVTGYAALEPAEAAALGRCGPDCVIAARLVPEDFDGQRTNTLNAAQAEVRAGLSRAALLQATRSSFFYVLAWSDEGAVGTGRIGDLEAAHILALQECRALQARITGLQEGAPPCRSFVVSRPMLMPRP